MWDEREREATMRARAEKSADAAAEHVRLMHGGVVATAPTFAGSATLLRQAAEAQARKLDADKEYWSFGFELPRSVVPAWVLYDRPEKRLGRTLQWLADVRNVPAWPGQHEQRAIGQPAPLSVTITDKGSSIEFQLVGWRKKGLLLRCVDRDGVIVFEQASEGGTDATLSPQVADR